MGDSEKFNLNSDIHIEDFIGSAILSIHIQQRLGLNPITYYSTP